MRPTRIGVLIALIVLAGAAAYGITDAVYSDLPALPLYGPILLLVLAAVEGYTAVTTSARLAGRPGTQPIHPITVARIAVLAKATSPVASLAAGGYAGFLVYVARLDSTQASADLRVAAVGVAASLLLTVAALAMERVCRVKHPPSSDENDH